MGRQRADALDRPSRDPLPPHAGRQSLLVSRLRSESTRRPMAASRRQLRRHDCPLLRQRCRGGLESGRGCRRHLEHLAHRRLRQRSRRLLRRPHRRDSRLRPRAQHDRGTGRHEPAARDHRPRRTHHTWKPRRHREHGNLDLAGVDRLDGRHGRRRLPRLRRRCCGGHDVRHLVHGHRPHLLHRPSARSGGVRRCRQHVAARVRQRLDHVLRSVVWPRRGVRVRGGSRNRCERRVRKRQERDDHRRVMGDGPQRHRALIRRHR